jgi:hypothetical protein
VEDAAPIVKILPAKRDIESVEMASSLDVGGGCAFAEHLKDGIAGDEVDQEKDERNYQPDYGQGVQGAEG